MYPIKQTIYIMKYIFVSNIKNYINRRRVFYSLIMTAKLE